MASTFRKHKSEWAQSFLSVLHRRANVHSGMSRSTILLQYKTYVRPILEFHWTMFSGLPNYRHSRLFVLERRALCSCWGLALGVADDVSCYEAQIPTLQYRFSYLTVSAYLRFIVCPWLRSNISYWTPVVSFDFNGGNIMFRNMCILIVYYLS